MVNSLPCQVEAMSLHPINTLLGQVGVTPCKSEGIEPFTMVNSPPCQVRVTPHKSEGIEPFTTVNSPLCQVGVTPHNLGGIEPSTLINSLPGQVGATPLQPINTLLVPCKVASSVFSHAPVPISPSVAPVLP